MPPGPSRPRIATRTACGATRERLTDVNPNRWLRVGVLLIFAVAANASAQLRIPAFTAYAAPDPEPEGLHISSRSGISNWTDPKQKVSWFGEIKHTGKLDCSLAMRLPAGSEVRFRLSSGTQSAEATATGGGTNIILVSFGA